MRLDTKQKRVSARDAEIEALKAKGGIVQNVYDLIIVRYTSILIGKERPCVKIYKGTGYRPTAFHYFNSEEQREKIIDNHIAYAEKNIARKSERAKQRKGFQHNLKVDDILYSSWGYDQTNIDFYQVTKVLGRKVELREIAGRLVNGEEGFMSGHKTAIKDEFVGDSQIRIPQGLNSSKSLYIKVSECSSAWIWDGQPKQCSWYA